MWHKAAQSSLFVLFKDAASVRTGEHSQEITFDFITAEAGIHLQAQALPGHRYRIEA